MNFTLDPMTPEDWPDVRAVFAEGLAAGLAAFMSKPPDWDEWHEGHLPLGRLVARASDGAIAGWAALTPVPNT